MYLSLEVQPLPAATLFCPALSAVVAFDFVASIYSVKYKVQRHKNSKDDK